MQAWMSASTLSYWEGICRSEQSGAARVERRGISRALSRSSRSLERLYREFIIDIEEAGRIGRLAGKEVADCLVDARGMSGLK